MKMVEIRTKDINTVFKVIDSKKRTFEAVASSRVPDLVGDIVEPAALLRAWAEDYKNFPTIRFMHKEEPIGKIEDIRVQGDDVIIQVKISKSEDSIWQKIEEGILGGMSIGFLPQEWEDLFDEKGNFTGRHFTKLLWIETSVVDRPCNPRAIIMQNVPILDLQIKGIYAFISKHDFGVEENMTKPEEEKKVEEQPAIEKKEEAPEQAVTEPEKKSEEVIEPKSEETVKEEPKTEEKAPEAPAQEETPAPEVPQTEEKAKDEGMDEVFEKQFAQLFADVSDIKKTVEAFQEATKALATKDTEIAELKKKLEELEFKAKVDAEVEKRLSEAGVESEPERSTGVTEPPRDVETKSDKKKAPMFGWLRKKAGVE